MESLISVKEIKGITAKTVVEVKEQVEALLQFKRFVCSNEEEVREHFSGVLGENPPFFLEDELVQKFTLRGNMNGDWQTTITVSIVDYYVDSGSDDYCSIVNVVED